MEWLRRLARLLFRYTLNNVFFGIALMTGIGLYIAIGSGFPTIRSYFELSDLDFFNAWPLKTMMVLLCANLATITWNRIPLTPPRYGVWCIHSGIITLIVGMSFYYHFKVEGRTLIQLGHTVNCFYDTTQRALYARVINQPVYGMEPLPSLPRFGSYSADDSPGVFDYRDLSNITKMVPIVGDSHAPQELGKLLGLDQPVRLDVVGYYPYADVLEDVLPDDSSGNVGVALRIDAPHAGDDNNTLTLCSADSSAAKQWFDQTELEHRDVSPEALTMIRESANHIFRISVTLPNHAAQQFDGAIGKPITLPDNSYTLTPELFDPAFRTIGTQEVVPELILHIVSNAGGQPKEFWRSILQGSTLQTDFKMDPLTTPPMMKGNRQKDPLDKDLVLEFKFDDPAGLMPSSAGDKHTFITSGDHDLFDIYTSFTKAGQITDLSSGGQISLTFDSQPLQADVYRMNHVKVVSHILEMPTARRVKDTAESGEKQALMVRVTSGNWSQTVCVPCDLYPAPDPATMEPTEPWAMGVVRIPGASSPIQLQLGFTCRPMPADLTLHSFELIHYPGGQGDVGPYRDFRATLEMTDSTGESTTQVASLNSPIYFDDGKWIFFQAGYDPNGQFTTIGVGNRPGVGIMISGCVMIVAGLMYAFYVKPLVVRRMKAAALERMARMKEGERSMVS
jgi:hypothetical protein